MPNMARVAYMASMLDIVQLLEYPYVAREHTEAFNHIGHCYKSTTYDNYEHRGSRPRKLALSN